MEISNAIITIFYKVVLPLTAHLASYLKLNLTLKSLVSMSFCYGIMCGELAMLTYYDLMPWAAAFPEQLLFLTSIMVYTRPLIFCIFYLFIRSCSLYITVSFVVLILLYVSRWSSIFSCVFYFASAEVAESLYKQV